MKLLGKVLIGLAGLWILLLYGIQLLAWLGGIYMGRYEMIFTDRSSLLSLAIFGAPLALLFLGTNLSSGE
jgi:hypothetical protein